MVRILLVLALTGCVGGVTSNAVPDGSSGGSGGGGTDGSTAGLDAPAGLTPGSLAVQWMHGSQNCNQNTDPDVQVLSSARRRPRSRSRTMIS